MDIHQERANYFKEFKDNRKPVYVISGHTENPGIPSLAFRKIDAEKIAVLAWMDEVKAEDWRKEHRLDSSHVVTLEYSELMRLLGALNPVQRKCYTIELV